MLLLPPSQPAAAAACIIFARGAQWRPSSSGIKNFVSDKQRDDDERRRDLKRILAGAADNFAYSLRVCRMRKRIELSGCLLFLSCCASRRWEEACL